MDSVPGPFASAVYHFGENCMGVRRAQIYHLKWVEKTHARLCKFLLQAFVCFYDVLIRSCDSLWLSSLWLSSFIEFLKSPHLWLHFCRQYCPNDIRSKHNKLLRESYFFMFRRLQNNVTVFFHRRQFYMPH